MVEVLVVCIAFVALMVAFSPLARIAGSSANQTQVRSDQLIQARHGLQEMSRELRQAATIEFLSPSAGMVFTDVGVSNRLRATTVIRSAGRSLRSVTYECGRSATSPNSTYCRSSFVDDGGANRTKQYLANPIDGHGPQLYNRAGTPPSNASESVGFGVFRLQRDGAGTATNPNFVQLRLLICVQSQRCERPGMTQPVEMKTGVSPRNLSTMP